MFDDLPSDLDQLRTLRIWHALWVQRIDAKAAAIRQRQAEEEYGRRNRPAPPEWIVELGIGAGRPPLQVHAGDCHMAGKCDRALDLSNERWTCRAEPSSWRGRVAPTVLDLGGFAVSASSPRATWCAGPVESWLRVEPSTPGPVWSHMVVLGDLIAPCVIAQEIDDQVAAASVRGWSTR
ncbi:hypothetical protein RKD37_000036 [Streptomyces ambofaciens]